MLWLLLLALGGAPFLGPILPKQDADGTWRCGGACHTAGNKDGGECRAPVFAKGQPTEKACRAELERQCSAKKPPPGGCQ